MDTPMLYAFVVRCGFTFFLLCSEIKHTSSHDPLSPPPHRPGPPRNQPRSLINAQPTESDDVEVHVSVPALGFRMQATVKTSGVWRAATDSDSAPSHSDGGCGSTTVQEPRPPNAHEKGESLGDGKACRYMTCAREERTKYKNISGAEDTRGGLLGSVQTGYVRSGR
ncbi:hypothetical protein EJ04DRAFT_168962 [Polyplosphaeria fusca]|uniref:Secreted protein n=1 Tax=Polyplosphaeria fusca TaxID=682080 RepID=A0A9P4V910_9PLEO|nr:hypothetical protein EJ04DRAFT_168962 [Polyplosphaeria fusca]